MTDNAANMIAERVGILLFAVLEFCYDDILYRDSIEKNLKTRTANLFVI